MNKTQFLELLIKSYGLTPKNVRYYKTGTNGGEYEAGIGWEGAGIDNDNKSVIMFQEPDGFNMAIYEILIQAKAKNLTPEFSSR